jgi:hypothetical protein
MSFPNYATRISHATHPSTPSGIDDLSQSTDENEFQRKAVQSIIKGRKSWKKLKGNHGEAVWPPYLENALIEGYTVAILVHP